MFPPSLSVSLAHVARRRDAGGERRGLNAAEGKLRGRDNDEARAVIPLVGSENREGWHGSVRDEEEESDEGRSLREEHCA